MSDELVIYSPEVLPEQPSLPHCPALVSSAGQRAQKRFYEFFAVHIRNPNTRAAYMRAVAAFFEWCIGRGVTLERIEPMMVALYIEELGRKRSAPTVKQHLAAIKMLFDWMVTGQVIPFNPASSVRGPRYSIKKGKTPIRDAGELRELFSNFDVETLVGLRDRALVACMFYSFARVSAVVGMDVQDYYEAGLRRMTLRLHEKGGKFHEVPAHHLVVEYVDAYLDAAGLRDQRKAPLFQTVRGRGQMLTGGRLSRNDAWAIIKRRCRDAKIPITTSCHSFRAAGITIFLENGGDLENAAAIAAHESPRTTKLYDRTDDAIKQGEIERIRL